MSLSPTFNLGFNENYITVPQSNVTSLTLYASGIFGYSSSVTVSLFSVSVLVPDTGVWSGNVSFSNTSLTPPSYTTISVNSLSSQASLYKVTIQGTDGSITQQASFNVNVTQGYPYYFWPTVTNISTGNVLNSWSMPSGNATSFYLNFYPVGILSYPNSVSLASVMIGEGLITSTQRFTIFFSSPVVDPGFTVASPSRIQLTVLASGSLGNANVGPYILTTTEHDNTTGFFATSIVAFSIT